MRATLATKATELRAWLLSAAAAFIGWWCAMALIAAGVRPVGWVLLGVAVATGVTSALYARMGGMRPIELAAFTVACMLLEWPVLALIVVGALSEIGVSTWG